jgi:hypothetical protein
VTSCTSPFDTAAANARQPTSIATGAKKGVAY